MKNINININNIPTFFKLLFIFLVAYVLFFITGEIIYCDDGLIPVNEAYYYEGLIQVNESLLMKDLYQLMRLIMHPRPILIVEKPIINKELYRIHTHYLETVNLYIKLIMRVYNQHPKVIVMN